MTEKMEDNLIEVLENMVARAKDGTLKSCVLDYSYDSEPGSGCNGHTLLWGPDEHMLVRATVLQKRALDGLIGDL